jgi:anti-anti-sigma factor
MSADEVIAASVRHQDGAVVLVVRGEVDISTVGVVRTAIVGVLAEEPSAFIIDLSAVTFLSSAGLKLLVQTAADVQRCRERAGQASGRTCFGVIATNPETRRPIILTGLDAIFPVFDTLDAALARASTKNESSA